MLGNGQSILNYGAHWFAYSIPPRLENSAEGPRRSNNETAFLSLPTRCDRGGPQCSQCAEVLESGGYGAWFKKEGKRAAKEERKVKQALQAAKSAKHGLSMGPLPVLPKSVNQ